MYKRIKNEEPTLRMIFELCFKTTVELRVHQRMVGNSGNSYICECIIRTLVQYNAGLSYWGNGDIIDDFKEDGWTGDFTLGELTENIAIKLNKNTNIFMLRYRAGDTDNEDSDEDEIEIINELGKVPSAPIIEYDDSDYDSDDYDSDDDEIPTLRVWPEEMM